MTKNLRESKDGGFSRWDLPAALSEERLTCFKSSLRDKYLEPARSLAEASSRRWGPIRYRSYDFLKLERKEEALRSLGMQVGSTRRKGGRFEEGVLMAVDRQEGTKTPEYIRKGQVFLELTLRFHDLF